MRLGRRNASRTDISRGGRGHGSGRHLLGQRLDFGQVGVLLLEGGQHGGCLGDQPRLQVELNLFTGVAQVRGRRGRRRWGGAGRSGGTRCFRWRRHHPFPIRQIDFAHLRPPGGCRRCSPGWRRAQVLNGKLRGAAAGIQRGNVGCGRKWWGHFGNGHAGSALAEPHDQLAQVGGFFRIAGQDVSFRKDFATLQGLVILPGALIQVHQPLVQPDVMRQPVENRLQRTNGLLHLMLHLMVGEKQVAIGDGRVQQLLFFWSEGLLDDDRGRRLRRLQGLRELKGRRGHHAAQPGIHLLNTLPVVGVLRLQARQLLIQLARLGVIALLSVGVRQVLVHLGRLRGLVGLLVNMLQQLERSHVRGQRADDFLQPFDQWRGVALGDEPVGHVLVVFQRGFMLPVRQLAIGDQRQAGHIVVLVQQPPGHRGCLGGVALRRVSVEQHVQGSFVDVGIGKLFQRGDGIFGSAVIQLDARLQGQHLGRGKAHFPRAFQGLLGVGGVAAIGQRLGHRKQHLGGLPLAVDLLIHLGQALLAGQVIRLQQQDLLHDLHAFGGLVPLGIIFASLLVENAGVAQLSLTGIQLGQLEDGLDLVGIHPGDAAVNGDRVSGKTRLDIDLAQLVEALQSIVVLVNPQVQVADDVEDGQVTRLMLKDLAVFLDGRLDLALGHELFGSREHFRLVEAHTKGHWRRLPPRGWLNL